MRYGIDNSLILYLGFVVPRKAGIDVVVTGCGGDNYIPNLPPPTSMKGVLMLATNEPVVGLPIYGNVFYQIASQHQFRYHYF